MNWNRRIIRKEINGEFFYQIHEIFYDERGISWTENPVSPFGETIEELQKEIKDFKAALSKPVLVERNNTLYVLKTGEPLLCPVKV